MARVLATSYRNYVSWADGKEEEAPSCELEMFKREKPVKDEEGLQTYFDVGCKVFKKEGNDERSYGVIKGCDREAGTCEVRWFKLFLLDVNKDPELLKEETLPFIELTAASESNQLVLDVGHRHKVWLYSWQISIRWEIVCQME